MVRLIITQYIICRNFVFSDVINVLVPILRQTNLELLVETLIVYASSSCTYVFSQSPIYPRIMVLLLTAKQIIYD
jgi:hypothetical protein